MRKSIVPSRQAYPKIKPEQGWFDLEELASVEVSSEHPNFPIETALGEAASSGWRSAEPGDQRIRIIFDNAVTLQRIQLQFDETDTERTQQFTLRWSTAVNGPMQELFRQQWNFSPSGSTAELEQYAVDIHNVAVVELEIRPDIGGQKAFASLTSWRLG